MGFYLKHLPSAKKLKEKREELQDDDKFLTWVYGRCDAFIGSIKSFKYLKRVKHERKTANKPSNTKV
jgi:hypothetical protein